MLAQFDALQEHRYLKNEMISVSEEFVSINIWFIALFVHFLLNFLFGTPPYKTTVGKGVKGEKSIIFVHFVTLERTFKVWFYLCPFCFFVSKEYMLKLKEKQSGLADVSRDEVLYVKKMSNWSVKCVLSQFV